ncbi:MAG TPA: polyprenol monophosphomannose synthase [Bryobacteraceae bacterium]|nr:polyprenol monophosphomannose synthase [Bryobacteraceae bacterium]
MMRAIVVVPTYNERESLPLFLEKLHQSAPGVDALIVDDNSPDGTGQLADELSGRSGNRIFVLHREKKEGLGRAYVAGFGRALEMGYDVILQMDADLSHDPGYIPAFLERIQDCGLVLGSRYVHGICVVNWDFKRLLLSKAATRYVQLVTGMKFTDATGGFKCWRAETLRLVGLDRVFSNGYLFQIEMTYRAFQKSCRIAEIPIIFHERNLGRSKMDGRIVWEALWGVLRLRLSASR